VFHCSVATLLISVSIKGVVPTENELEYKVFIRVNDGLVPSYSDSDDDDARPQVVNSSCKTSSGFTFAVPICTRHVVPGSPDDRMPPLAFSCDISVPVDAVRGDAVHAPVVLAGGASANAHVASHPVYVLV